MTPWKISECASRRQVQRYATAGNEPLSDAAIMRLTLPVFEATGVFTSAVEKWRDLDEANWTLPNYQLHFQKANKERRRKLTAQMAGYHGAHHAAITSHQPAAAPNHLPLATAAAATTPVPAPNFQVTTDSQQFYYC